MQLLEKKSLKLFRKYKGHSSSELDVKQLKKIDELYQRFISICKRIESKLNCPDSIFIYPDQYMSIESGNILSENWTLTIFPTREAYNLYFGYYLSLDWNLKIGIGCFDNVYRKLTRELMYFIKKFHQNYKTTFFTTQINQELSELSFIDKLVDLIKIIDFYLDIHTRKTDILEIRRAGLFPSFLFERETALELWHLKNGNIEQIPDLNLISLLIQLEILENNQHNAIELITLFFGDEDATNSYSKAEDEEDIFQNRAQKGKRVELPPGPKLKLKPMKKNSQIQWNRNPNISFTALDNAFFKCEFNPLHESFISDNIGKPYMEGHHLIPMQEQENISVSLDVPENIICLCSTCHNAFHHATPVLKFELINVFFKSRKEALVKRGINTSIEELLKSYNISKHILH